MQTFLSNKKSFVEKWLCHLYAEQDLKNDIITFDEFAENISTCDFTYEESMEYDDPQDSFPDNDNDTDDSFTPPPNLTIIPNPNAGNFTMEIYSEVHGSKIKITNAYGQPVRNISLTDEGEQSVYISGLAQGNYTVYYLEQGVVIASENMIVE